jgi:hypothetical protein
MKKILMGVLFSICLFVCQAAAQMPLGPVPLQSTQPQNFMLYQSYWNNYYLGQTRFNMAMVAAAKRNLRSRSNTNNRTVKNQVVAPVDYTAFKAVERRLPKMFAQSAKDNTGQTEKLLNSFLDLYEQTARKDEFPANDLAYAFNYFVVNTYMTAKDSFWHQQGNLDRDMEWYKYRIFPDQETAIYKQYKEALSSNPEIKKMTDQQKQEFTEMLAIMTNINYTAYSKGLEKGDEKMVNQARESAKQTLEKFFGVSIDRLVFSKEGLTIKE